MSQQERISWVALIVNLVISLCYFAWILPMPGERNLLGFSMTPLIVTLIFLATVVGVASELLLRWVQRRMGGDPRRLEQLDERDRLIGLRAGRNAYNVLVVGIAVVLGHIATTQWLGPIQPLAGSTHDTVLMRLATGPLTGSLIAQLLLLALTLATLCKLVTRIMSYRRGY